MSLLVYLVAIFLGFSLAKVLIFLGKKVLFSVPFLHDPVFVPSSDAKLATMIKLGKPTRKSRILDLGSGDGKIVLALANHGFSAVGVEINPWLVRKSRQAASRLGLKNRATFIRQSFWKVDYSKYDLIFLYATSYIMERLERKLQAELKPGTRVVSNHFTFPNWRHKNQENDVFLYQKENLLE